MSDRRIAQIERDVFIGCYSVRKLMQSAAKLTDASRAMQVNLTWYRNTKAVTLLDWHEIEKFYDLTKAQSEVRDLEFFCGRIIHSFIFVPELNEAGGLCGFYFGSDKDRSHRLYHVTLGEVVRVFVTVGKDNPRSVRLTRDPVSGEEKWEAK
jgi:hypothetical protein